MIFTALFRYLDRNMISSVEFKYFDRKWFPVVVQRSPSDQLVHLVVDRDVDHDDDHDVDHENDGFSKFTSWSACTSCCWSFKYFFQIPLDKLVHLVVDHSTEVLDLVHSLQQPSKWCFVRDRKSKRVLFGYMFIVQIMIGTADKGTLQIAPHHPRSTLLSLLHQ